MNRIVLWRSSASVSVHSHYILWGSTGHAKVLADIIGWNGGRVVALFDNDPEVVSSLEGVPLFRGTCGFQQWLAGQDSLRGLLLRLRLAA